MTRILALPVDAPASAEACPISSVAGRPLRDLQASALATWRGRLAEPDGPWGPRGLAILAGCGEGKTLLSLLLPAVMAGAVRGPWADAAGGLAPALARPVLYLVPASAVRQLQSDAVAWAAVGYPVATPLVLSHEALSAPSGRRALDSWEPAVLVIDEAHRFANPDSARWRRIAEYLTRRPDTRVVVMSGSLTWRSLRQCRHLLLAALRDHCPLPATPELGFWASALDADTEPSPDDLWAVGPLAEWLARAEPGRHVGPPVRPLRDALRDAYGVRLRTAPGVVAASGAPVPVALAIEVDGRRTPATIAEAYRNLNRSWALPDGSDILEASAYARARISIPLGFYQRWRPETVHAHYVEAWRTLARAVRRLVAYSAGWQTPGAVLEALREGAYVAREARMAYDAFRAAEELYPAPVSEVVWLPGGQAHVAAIVADFMALAGGPDEAIVWVQTPDLGTYLAEAFRIPYHGAGSAPPAGGLCVASSRVHGTGWNGAPAAGYRRALVLEPPANGGAWEQLLARLHRSDAREDVTYRVHPSDGAVSALENAVCDARYSAAVNGAQRLLLADWSGWDPGRVRVP